MQTRLTEENAKRLEKAANIIAQAFPWSDTDEGREYWNDVYERLLNKAANSTSDGKPYVEPEPPIPEGYRKANADEWRRRDVKYWDLCHKDWRPRLSQGIAFDPPAMHTRYIVPIDPPLTDKDAAVWPRRLVMVRSDNLAPWEGPYRYLGKTNSFYAVDSLGTTVFVLWGQARRATPEEIEAAK